MYPGKVFKFLGLIILFIRDVILYLVFRKNKPSISGLIDRYESGDLLPKVLGMIFLFLLIILIRFYPTL